MKRTFWAISIFTLMLVLCLVSACGGGDETTSPATTSPTTTAPTTTPTTTSPSETTTPPETTPTATEDVLEGLLNQWTGLEPVSYELSFTIDGQETAGGKIWQTSSKIRQEVVMEGETAIMIFDLDEDVMYMYFPDQNMATKTTVDPDMMSHGTLEGDMSSSLEYAPVIVGTETIDGKSCTVVAFDTGEMSIKLWVWTDTGFPIRTEGVSPDGITTVMEYTNIDFSDIPDSVFELPEGVEIISM